MCDVNVRSAMEQRKVLLKLHRKKGKKTQAAAKGECRGMNVSKSNPGKERKGNCQRFGDMEG